MPSTGGNKLGLKVSEPIGAEYGWEWGQLVRKTSLGPRTARALRISVH